MSQAIFLALLIQDKIQFYKIQLKFTVSHPPCEI